MLRRLKALDYESFLVEFYGKIKNFFLLKSKFFLDKFSKINMKKSLSFQPVFTSKSIVVQFDPRIFFSRAFLFGNFSINLMKIKNY